MKKSLNVIYRPRDMLVGNLIQHGNEIMFNYSGEFMDSGLNLSPFKLKFAPGLQRSDARFRQYLHGVFDDSLPDGWGVLLMDKELRRIGMRDTISPLDRLAFIGDNAMGALSYQPSIDHKDNNRELFDICKIAEDSIRFFDGETDDILPILARAGGSPGGARPKALIGLKGDKIISGESSLPEGYEPWLIKFAAKKEAATAGYMEYAHYRMAIDAGLKMMESRLFDVDGVQYFGTKRFDRIGNKRVHFHTVGNLVDANFREPALDYEALLRITRVLTRNRKDELMMFRLMVFNVAIENRDDHAKNFSFLMDDNGTWRMAPAYDLTRSVHLREHSTSVAGKGRDITRADMLAVASESGISLSDAHEIMDQVLDVVSASEKYEPNSTEYSFEPRMP